MATIVVDSPAFDVSGNASFETPLINGILNRVTVYGLTSLDGDGTASSNTFDITITEALGKQVLAVTGISGKGNIYDSAVQSDDESGTATGLFQPGSYTSNRFTVTIANGTATEFVRLYFELVV